MVEELGRLQPSRRQIDTLRPAIMPEAFGRGVGEALARVGQGLGELGGELISREVAETTVSEAYKARQRRVLGSQLGSELIRLESELSRESLEAFDAAPAGATGFTNQREAAASTRLEAFRQRVPEEMRPEFDEQIERIRQSQINSAFQLETNAENAEFIRGLTDFQAKKVDEMLNLVIQDPAELDDFIDDTINQSALLFANSPLDAAATEAAAENFADALRATQLHRLSIEENLGRIGVTGEPGQLQRRGEAWYSSGPVAPGLPAVAVGFLNAISRPESGGEYNVMYSPGERRYFQDFSKHPNQGATIATGPYAGQTSTAAGRYQFIVGTWNAIAQQTGRTEFTPQNQDVNAWELGKQDYAARTGRDLEAVLRSGHIPSIIAAKEILIPTWQGLKDMSDEDFVNIIANATGNPSTLVNDPRFANIPPNERMAIYQGGLDQAAAVRQQQAADMQAERNRQMEALRQSIADGSATRVGLEQARQQLRMTVEEFDSVNKLYEDRNRAVVDTEAFIANIDNPSYLFKGTAEENRQFDNFLQTTGFSQAVANRDAEWMSGIFFPAVEATGVVPEVAANALLQQTASQNPQQASFALEALEQLLARSPNAFDTRFSDDQQSMIAFYSNAKAVLPQDELLQTIRRMNDPRNAGTEEQIRAAISQNVKDFPDDFAPQGIASQMGLTSTMTPAASGALFNEYSALYQQQIRMGATHRDARNAATTILGNRWGEFEVFGNAQTMRYPPNKVHPPFMGNHDWINEQLSTMFILPEGANVQFISDHVTDAEKNSGQPPSYRLQIMDENGLPRVLTIGDLQGIRNNNYGEELLGALGEPARYTPTITPTMEIEAARLSANRQSYMPDLAGLREGQGLDQLVPEVGLQLPDLEMLRATPERQEQLRQERAAAATQSQQQPPPERPVTKTNTEMLREALTRSRDDFLENSLIMVEHARLIRAQRMAGDSRSRSAATSALRVFERDNGLAPSQRGLYGNRQ